MTDAWETVGGGQSGAALLRRGGIFRKIAPDAEAEATKLAWLRDQGIHVPEVLDVRPGAFDMQAAPGLPADSPWSEQQGPWVLDAIADTVRSLHALPAPTCPFDRFLAVVIPEARRAAATGTVDLHRLDPEREGWTAAQLLAELEAALPSPEELRVTHGDLSLDNIIVDPSRRRITLIDVGRAGTADLHTDLAILTRGLRDHWTAGDPEAAQRRVVERYGSPLDPARVRLYRLIDEFF